MDRGFIKPSVCSIIKATGGEPNYYKQACRNNRRGLILQKEKIEFRTDEILLLSSLPQIFPRFSQMRCSKRCVAIALRLGTLEIK